jgi:hypothetical protein
MHIIRWIRAFARQHDGAARVNSFGVLTFARDLFTNLHVRIAIVWQVFALKDAGFSEPRLRQYIPSRVEPWFALFAGSIISSFELFR